MSSPIVKTSKRSRAPAAYTQASNTPAANTQASNTKSANTKSANIIAPKTQASNTKASKTQESNTQASIIQASNIQASNTKASDNITKITSNKKLIKSSSSILTKSSVKSTTKNSDKAKAKEISESSNAQSSVLKRLASNETPIKQVSKDLEAKSILKYSSTIDKIHDSNSKKRKEHSCHKIDEEPKKKLARKLELGSTISKKKVFKEIENIKPLDDADTPPTHIVIKWLSDSTYSVASIKSLLDDADDIIPNNKYKMMFEETIHDVLVLVADSKAECTLRFNQITNYNMPEKQAKEKKKRYESSSSDDDDLVEENKRLRKKLVERDEVICAKNEQIQQLKRDYDLIKQKFEAVNNVITKQEIEKMIKLSTNIFNLYGTNDDICRISVIGKDNKKQVSLKLFLIHELKLSLILLI
jgi:hypothetical protein